MVTERQAIWDSYSPQQFATVLAQITDTPLMQNFLRDVMTEKEIIEMSSRFQAACMLREGKKYTEIIEATKLSSRTIARISDWIQNGSGGYSAAIELTNRHHHAHLSPARAE